MVEGEEAEEDEAVIDVLDLIPAPTRHLLFVRMISFNITMTRSVWCRMMTRKSSGRS